MRQRNSCRLIITTTRTRTSNEFIHARMRVEDIGIVYTLAAALRSMNGLIKMFFAKTAFERPNGYTTRQYVRAVFIMLYIYICKSEFHD